VFTDEFLAQQRLLVISPHADDETYGCAGTIGRVKALGGSVHVVLVSVGDLCQYSNDPQSASTVLVPHQTRLREFDAAMKQLKVDDWEVLFTDAARHMAMETVPRKHLVGLLESGGRLAIDIVEPTMVMIPASSYNQDHEAVFQACVTATRPGVSRQKFTVPFVLTYDNTALFWSGTDTRFQPNCYIDVSDFLEVKIDTLRLHASQIRERLYHGSPESLELATRLRGREIGVEAAEGFRLLRGVF
jgi:LmbE family N-acetylglucosaminyl deacetylase